MRPGFIPLMCLLLIGSRAVALETDQFTVPPAPLIDIAPQFQQHVTAVLQGVVSRTNIRFVDESRAAARAAEFSAPAGADSTTMPTEVPSHLAASDANGRVRTS